VLEAFATSFATMFVMIDPIGLAPMFAALTAGMNRRQRMAVAGRGVAVAGLILVIFALAGDGFLKVIGVSMPAFRIAGGLMLFLLSVEMLFQKRTERREKETGSAVAPDPSVFPLATPLIAGPGALAAIILLATEHQGGIADQSVVYLATLAVLAVCFVTFLATEMIERVLGQTGINVLTRLFGLLLGALAVQFILDGAAEYWASVFG